MNRKSLCFFGVLLLALSGADALAAPPGPGAPAVEALGRLLAREDGPGMFQLARPRVGLGTSYEMITETRESSFGDSRDTSHEIREWTEVETSGSLYHPGLLKFTLNVRPEWAQRLEDHTGAEFGPDRDEPEEGFHNFFLPRYSGRLSLLSAKPYTLSLFARRSRTPVLSAFAQRTETQSDTFGADLSWRNAWAPATVNYWHSDVEETGFFHSTERGDNLTLSVNRDRKSGGTSLQAAFHDQTRIAAENETRVKSSSASLWDSRDFREGKVRLLSWAGMNQTQTDQFDSRFFNFSEDLTLTHARNLETRYRLSHDESQWTDNRRSNNALTAQISHLFRERLTTTLVGRGELDDFTDGREQAYEGRLDFAYNTPIPWGTVQALVSHGYGVRFRDTVERVAPFTESMTLSSTAWSLATQRDIDLSSFVVTNEAGSTVYVAGLDYRVQAVGALVRVSRTPFGGIADGQTVRVTYDYRTNPSYDSALISQRYELGIHLFNGLSLDYSFFRQQDNVLSGTPPDLLSDRVSQLLRLGYERGFSRTELTLEKEDQPYGLSMSSWRGQETLQFRRGDALFLTLSGYYGNRRLKDLGRNEAFYGGRSRLEWVLSDSWRATAEGFMDVVSGDFEDVLDQGADFGVEFYSGIWKARINYTYLEEEDRKFGESRTYNRIFLEIGRDLF